MVRHRTGHPGLFVITKARLWWTALVLLLATELWLAHALRQQPAAFEAWLGDLVEWTASHALVVHNFDVIGINTRALNLYFGTTLWLLLPKVAFWYWWLNSNFAANGRYFVITPETQEVAGGLREFALEPVQPQPAGPPRSMGSRVFWSCLEVFIAIVGLWAMLRFGYGLNEHTRPGESMGFHSTVGTIVQMGTSLWLPWSVFYSGITSLFLAIAVVVLLDSAFAILGWLTGDPA